MSRSLLLSVARCACIDIGSNTTRLLVAEDDDTRLRELLAERAFTRLASACDAHGEIAPGKIAEIAEIVARQARMAAELGARSVRLVATSAVREALNARALAAAIDAACRLQLEVLTGEEEARLAFAGATGILPDVPAGELGVIDVGGGSTELVVGTAREGVTWSVSLPVGSSGVTDAELPHDPPSVQELARLRGRLAARLGDVEVPSPSCAYVVGGSASSLQRVVGGVLGRESLMLALQQVTLGPSAEMALRLGLHAERVRLLPAAILLLDAASHAFCAPLRMGAGGLREGIVLEQLARIGAE
jgi:exopolyphosphatase/guanosine-5'-triphosphate,3'-diphosphate pyrophosphatase